MNLILCCATTSLRERWAEALGTVFTTDQATTLEDLRILVGQRISFDLLFVHRSLVDRDSIAYIRARRPACKLLILSDRPEEEEGIDFLRMGVVGYTNSYSSPERLQEAARAVAGGSVWVSQSLMFRLIAHAVPPTSDIGPRAVEDGGQRRLEHLSDREYQIASLVADGLANSEIADQLGITERTVKAHLGAVYTKTSAKGRLALALLMRPAHSPG